MSQHRVSHAGHISGQLRTPTMDLLATRHDSRGRLEHRSGVAHSGDYRVSPCAKGRRPDSARGGSKRAANWISEYSRRDRTATADELCVRLRVSRTGTRPARL